MSAINIKKIVKKFISSFFVILLLFSNVLMVKAEDDQGLEENDPNTSENIPEPEHSSEEGITPFNLEEPFPSELHLSYNQNNYVKYNKYQFNANDDLDGRSFAIVFNTTAMIPTYKGGLVKNNKGSTVLDGYWMETASFDTSSLLNPIGLQNWVFERAENGGYYLKCSGTDYYLSAKEPNEYIPSGGSSEFGDNVPNRPSSLVLTKDKQEFSLVSYSGGVQFRNRTLGRTVAINNFWANGKFVTTTWPANTGMTLYYADPFSIDSSLPLTSFNQNIQNYGIVTKKDGTTVVGDNSNRLLPEVAKINKNTNEYVLDIPANFDEITGNYVLTNVNIALNNQDIDARNGVINENLKNAKPTLSIDDYICPGNQYKFLGYIAEDLSGNEIILNPGTKLEWGSTADSIFLRAITEDQIIELKYGQTIRMNWLYISSLASFHIDFTGTILEEDGDIQRRTEAEDLTWGVAIATIYNGTSLGDNITMSTAVDKKVRDEFVVYDYDETNSNTQIVMELYADIPTLHGNKVWVNAKHNNLENIQSHFFKYIKNSRDDVSFKVTPASNNATILDKLNSSTDNYSVRWYSITPDDGVGNINIKGTLVAKTTRTTITSHFDGLPGEILNDLLKDYYLDLSIDNPNNNYLKLKVNENPYDPSISKYNGHNDDFYTWEYKSLYGSKTYYKEENNQVDGYKLVTVLTQDNVLVTEPDKAFTGKDNTSLVFYNCYTEYEKGMFLISKISDDGKDLKGSKFLLKSLDNGYEIQLVSNSSGIILFNDLEPGNYILEEIEAPLGFYKNDDKWYIRVVSDEDNPNDTIVFVHTEDSEESLITDTSANLIIPISIENKSTANTLTFEKIFRGEITNDQVKDLFEHGYTITISSDSGYNKTFTKDNAIVSNDGMSYYWTLIDVAPGIYSLEESNMDAHYKSTNIEIELANNNLDITDINVLKVPESATFTLDVKNGLSTLKSTSSYRNTIYLDIHKVSSKDSNIKLKDAKFHVYTSVFKDANILNAPANTLKQISYIDKAGLTNLAYYLAEAVTDEKGLSRLTGLNYDADYILVEYESPSGYALDPEYVVVYKALENENYINGILNVTVANEPSTFRIIKKSSQNTNVYSAIGAEHEFREVLRIENGEVILSEPVSDLEVKYINKSYNYANLPLNKIYQITEKSPPPGYIKDDAKYYSMLCDSGTSPGENLINLESKLQEIGVNVIKTEEITLYNDLNVSYRLKVNKVDGDSLMPIINSGFTLYRLANEDDPIENVKSIKTSDGVKDCVIAYDERLTEFDGDKASVTFTELKGNDTKYYLLETRGVIGYLSSDVAIEVKVNTIQYDDGTIIRKPVIKGIETHMNGDVLEITLNSYSKLEIPSAGSDLTIYYYLVAGLAVIACSLLLLIYFYKSFRYF